MNFQGCDSEASSDGSHGLFIFTAVLGLVMLIPMVFSWLGWFAVSNDKQLDTSSDNQPGTGSDNEAHADAGSHDASLSSVIQAEAAAAPTLANPDACSSHEAMGDPPTTDASGMPRFSKGRDLPLPGEAWSPEAMLTWMHERCMRRHSNAQTDERRRLYAERMAVLRGVMGQCRAGDEESRLAASAMTREMRDISEDENSPTYDPSVFEMHAVLDDAEGAVNSGNQLVNVMTASSNADPAARSHVDRVADAMINIFAGAENVEEEEQTESDVEMETQSERMRRYLSSEM